MDLIDEENITLLKVGQHGCQITRTFNNRPGCCPDIAAHFIGNNIGKGGFSQSGRTKKEHVVQGLRTALGGLNVDRNIIPDLLLPNVFRK